MSADASALRDAISQMIIDAGDQATVDLFNGLDVPVASGDTKASGEITFLGGGAGSGSWSIEFPTPQALFTDEGTAAHEIRGNPILAFEVDGRTVFATVVQHPGYAGTGWFSGPDGITPERWADALSDALAVVAP